jgi:hypothetical protein
VRDRSQRKLAMGNCIGDGLESVAIQAIGPRALECVLSPLTGHLGTASRNVSVGCIADVRLVCDEYAAVQPPRFAVAEQLRRPRFCLKWPNLISLLWMTRSGNERPVGDPLPRLLPMVT